MWRSKRTRASMDGSGYGGGRSKHRNSDYDGEAWQEDWGDGDGSDHEDYKRQEERDWDRRRSRYGDENGYKSGGKHRGSPPDYKSSRRGGDWDRHYYGGGGGGYDRDDPPPPRRDYRDRRSSGDRDRRSRYDRRGVDFDEEGRYRRDHSPESLDSFDDYYSGRGGGGSSDGYGRGGGSSRDSDAYRNQAPNNTVMIKGLAYHITENDIRKDILQCNLMPRDIRLIRKKDTGQSRGFAFVEFNTVAEATQWMQRKGGTLVLQDQYRAEMYYSIPKDPPGFGDRGAVQLKDWHCVKCGANNFKRRDACFKCGASRKESEEGGEGSDEVSPHPTNTVLLRNLDVLSTEEAVLGAIKGLSSTAIRSIRMGRDPLTNTSRGVCYIELNSVLDSVQLHGALQGRLTVDGRKALVSYCKLPSQQHEDRRQAQAAGLAAYGPEDIPRLAEYSASMYATSPQEHAAYVAYYTQYYEAQVGAASQSATVSAPPSSVAGGATQTQTDSVNAAAAVALSAIQQVQAAREIKKQVEGPAGKAEGGRKGSATVASLAAGTLPTSIQGAPAMPYVAAGSTTLPRYAVPDVATYRYDETSGYYYDSSTGLYYDAGSQYYYNPQTQQFLYWDAERQTYVPTPVQGAAASGVAATAGATTTEESGAGGKDDPNKKSKDNKQDKVKVAKKIAKDMERWAKTLNQKKDNPQATAVATSAVALGKSVGAADAGYAILERKERSLDAQVSQFVARMGEEGPGPASPAATGGPGGLVAAYGGGSESDDDIDDVLQEERLHTDWTKLACLLCKRQFPSKETLQRHNQLSDLHRQNLEAWYRVRGLDQNDPQQRNSRYRDRAKERRSKFGTTDPTAAAPHPNRLKEKFLKAREEAARSMYEEPTRAGIGSENVGNRLLQKMGWQEGMGLGKSNQGRTSIVQTDVRNPTAGLGSREAAAVPVLPGEKYKDRVKKMMFARYQELTEQEQAEPS
ncbi:RNA-binding protein 5-like isoform X1 [Schistocerca nitens]|uniref:RNA-binding protein 5-like isoform X1 n=2 Tax=Schistocerca nitens TaxID=7011 RepID=UPI0021196CB4|nr:RNA-binding protein 5-like isoform X1 [Schistocerca nitens]XP_049794342.1 RNA-binding protein 5-like isoform X1 [Schistocerca nitens]XP_049794343.1 RNA-binding protein 5-like isoform X1 [Schistocerca nitens]